MSLRGYVVFKPKAQAPQTPEFKPKTRGSKPQARRPKPLNPQTLEGRSSGAKIPSPEARRRHLPEDMDETQRPSLSSATCCESR